METRSEWQGGAEIATIVHNGNPFVALGAMIAPDYVVGYTQKHEATGRYALMTWEGAFMFVEVLPGKKWRRWSARGCTDFQEWRAVINGYVWVGRQGDCDLLRLRRTKRAA